MRTNNLAARQTFGVADVPQSQVSQWHSGKDGSQMKMTIEMEMDDWLQYGYHMGWCSPPVCYIHDGLPTSILEDTDLEDGDPCIHLIRLYEDGEHKKAVEANHSPSVWRAANLGWT